MRRLAIPALVAACGPADRPPMDAAASGAEQVAAPAPPDSLALITRSGVELWFVTGREAVGEDGVQCYERGLEIRDDAGRRGVPLLYTLTVPTVLDDTSVRAVVSNRCRPGDAYRVSLRTGRPTPLAER